MLRDGSVGGEATWCGVENDTSREQRCAALHRTLKRIVKARGALEAQEAAALREAEALGLWRHYGYASLLEYMEMEMGYTPRAALERLRVAKAIEHLPEIADAMTQGDLSFSAARELTRVATPDTEDQWLEAADDKNVRQLEALVAGRKRGDRPTDPPDPKLRKRALRYEDIAPETAALVAQARQILERELGERLTDDGLLRAFARSVIDGAASPERTRAPYQIAVATCGDCKRTWQDGAGMTVEMSPATAEAAECDAQRIGAVDGPGTKKARQDVPPALRRKVLRRDHGRCRVPWCRSSRNLDQHHLKPRAESGPHTEGNLITICESHHLAHHEGSLLITGDATNATFTRRAHTSFTAAAHAVDAARALASLGFDKHEVKLAIERTCTHVGTSTLSLEQWIKIALGYCPRPIT